MAQLSALLSFAWLAFLSAQVHASKADCQKYVTGEDDDDIVTLLQISSRVGDTSRIKNTLAHGTAPAVGQFKCVVDPMLHRQDLAGACMCGGVAIVVSILFLVAWCTPLDVQPEPIATLAVAQVQALTRIHSIEGLRVVLCLYIVLYHMGEELPSFVRLFGAEFSRKFFADAVVDSFMPFFFVTSGFVCLLSVDRKRVSFNYSSGVTFFLKRVTRLAPLFYVALFWEFIVAQFVPRPSGLLWTLQAMFLDVISPITICEVEPRDGSMFMGNYSGWFVSDMLWLSACFPWLHNILPDKRKYLLVAIVAAVSLNFVIVTPWVRKVAYNFLLTPQPRGADLYIWAPFRTLQFVAGMLTAKLANRLPEKIHGWFGWGWLFDGSLLLAAGLIVRWNYFPITDAVGLQAPLGFYTTGPFCLACFSAHFASKSPRGISHRGILGSLLAATPLQILAPTSYAVFILQAPIGQTLSIIVSWWMGNIQYNWWMVFTRVAVAYLVALLANKLIEEPSQKALDSLLGFVRKCEPIYSAKAPDMPA